MKIDICIPSWNSLEYLKLCVAGIKKNTKIPYDIIVHDNGSDDGTKEYLVENKIRHTESSTNLGFCGVNSAIRASTSSHVMIMNTDMIPLPGYDTEIFQKINDFRRKKIYKYTISSCLIEPVYGNPEYDFADCGTTAETFDSAKLKRIFLEKRASFYSRPNTVQYSHPITIPKDMLQRVNYFDDRYFPGWAVDHDLAATLYSEEGCRDFIMLSRSRVYHFSSKTFKKLPKDIQAMDGQNIFFEKHQMSVEDFRQMINIRKVVS